MQNSLWKLVTAAGIIGIGTLVVLEVQHRLPGNVPAELASTDAATSQSGVIGEKQMTPDSTTEFDLMFGALAEPSGSSDTAVATQNRRNATADEAVDTSVARANLLDDANPFAAFEPDSGAGRTADENLPTVAEAEASRFSNGADRIATGTLPSENVVKTALSEDGNKRSIAQASHSQEGQPFQFDDSEAGESSLPVFNLGDAQESESTASHLPHSPHELSALAPVTETPHVTSQGGLNADSSDPVELFAQDDAPATQITFDETDAAQPPPAASESADSKDTVFIPFQADDDDAVGGSGGTPSVTGTPDSSLSDWPELTSPVGTTPVDSSPGFAEDSANAPLFDRPEPAPEAPFQESQLTGDGKSPAGDSSFFKEDGAATELPPLGNVADHSHNGDSVPFPADPVAPFESDNRSNDAEDTAIGHHENLNIGRPDPTAGTLDSDFPPLPIREPSLSSRDIPDLNLTPAPFEQDLTPSPDPGNLDVTFPEADRAVGLTEVVAASATMTNVMRPHLTIEKIAPETATVGVPLEYTITVRNDGQSPACGVVVEDQLPSSADLETAHPIPAWDRETRRMSWQIDELAAGTSQSIRIRIVPTGEGTLDGVATVRFKAQVKSTTQITAPRLHLTMSGPSEVRLGETVSFTFVIKNEGSGIANNVILRNVLPAGLQHPEGNDLEYEIDRLESGEEQEITLAVVAAEPGEFNNAAEVTSAGIATDSTSVPIQIVGAQLTIERLGPQRRYVGRPAQFQNIISNETVFDATDAVVIERVPDGLKFVSAGNGGEYNPSERLITWRIPTVPSGKQILLDVELAAERRGEVDSVIEVIEQAGFRSRATKTVAIEDIHNISADISRLSGPVAVGEKFGFSIVVDNRGTAVAGNVTLNVEVPTQILVLAAGSKDMSASRTPDNIVHYATILEIGPNEKKVFRLSLQGDEPVQNAIVKAHLKYDGMNQTLVVSESVTVYSDSL
jgi:uncharacterized repeat protein (TIGR01451 family)